jgi:hypothetical protein
MWHDSVNAEGLYSIWGRIQYCSINMALKCWRLDLFYMYMYSEIEKLTGVAYMVQPIVFGLTAQWHYCCWHKRLQVHVDTVQYSTVISCVGGDRLEWKCWCGEINLVWKLFNCTMYQKNYEPFHLNKCNGQSSMSKKTHCCIWNCHFLHHYKLSLQQFKNTGNICHLDMADCPRKFHWSYIAAALYASVIFY